MNTALKRLMASQSESALVVLVPEAEDLVRSFRERYDPSAADGMPAHITLLYPFKPPDEIDGEVIQALHDLFSGIPRFRFTLATARRFPGVLYLAPEPDGPLRELTRRVGERFPDRPPYGGAFREVIPHLTVADVTEDTALEPIARKYESAAAGKLPIEVTAYRVVLMDNLTDRWRISHWFALATG